MKVLLQKFSYESFPFFLKKKVYIEKSKKKLLL